MYKHFNDMCWPLPNPELDWRLRYGKPTREDLLVAASIVTAYGALVSSTRQKRDKVIRELRNPAPAKE